MNIKKSLSAFLAAAMVMTSFALPVGAEENETVSHKWDFESGADGWECYGKGNTAISDIGLSTTRENGNKFERLSYKVAANTGENGSGDEVASARYEFASPIQFKAGEVVKISARVRSNYVGGGDERPGLGMSINVYDEIIKGHPNGLKYPIQYGANALWSTDNSQINTRYGYETWGACWPYWVGYASVHSTERYLNANVWKNIDTYLQIGDNNKPVRAVTMIDGQKAGDFELSESNSILGQQTELSTLHFVTFSFKAVEAHDIAVDFDDVEVEENSAMPENVMSQNFENGLSGWYGFGTGNDSVSNISFANAEENGNKFARISYHTTASGENPYADVMPSARYTFVNPIQFKAGENIRISARVRTNFTGDNANDTPIFGLGVNMFREMQEGNINGNHAFVQYGINTLWNTEGSEIRMRHGNVGWGAHWPYWRNAEDSHNVGRLSDNEWADFDVYLTIGADNKPSHIILNKNGVQLGETDLNTADSSLAELTELSALSFFTCINRSSGDHDITVDFDNVEVEENASLPNKCYANETYESNIGGWEKCKNWADVDQNAQTSGGTNIFGVENGILRVGSTGECKTSDEGQYNLSGLQRKINGDSGVLYTAGKDIVIETRVRLGNESDNGAQLDIQMNRPVSTNYLDYKYRSQWYGTYTLLRISNNSIHGYSGVNDTYDEWVEIKKLYSGETKGKWFDVKIRLDGTNKRAYYFLKDEDGNLYSRVADMPWVKNGEWYDKAVELSKTGIYTVSCTLSATQEAGMAEAVGEMQYFKLYEEDRVESSITLKDENGIEKTSVSAGDKIKADYVIYPTVTGSAKYDVYIALYSVDEDGILTLESVKKKTENLYGTAEGSTETITVPTDGKYAVKAMIWQNSSLTPLVDAAFIK